MIKKELSGCNDKWNREIKEFLRHYHGNHEDFLNGVCYALEHIPENPIVDQALERMLMEEEKGLIASGL